MTTNTSLSAKATLLIEQIDKAMIKILGEDAFYKTDYQVTPAVQKLSSAVTYLTTQIRITASQFETNEERIEHVNGVIEQLVEILNNHVK